MAVMLNIIPEKCTGCTQCELACSFVQTGTFAPSRSLIRVNVFDEEASYAPHTCLQCDEAWCMNACPTNAIVIDAASGAKQVPTGWCRAKATWSVRKALNTRPPAAPAMARIPARSKAPPQKASFLLGNGSEG